MNTKCEIKWFGIPDWDKEGEYLRSMHQQGWQLDHIVFPCFYHFIECQPEDMIYQLDYNQEGVQRKGEYVQMFADCGWTYLFDFVGFSYFRKPAADGAIDESIFCDHESRVQMMERVIKGRMTPLAILFFLVLVPQFFNFSLKLDDPICFGLFVLYAALLVVYALIFVYVAGSYHVMKNRKDQ